MATQRAVDTALLDVLQGKKRLTRKQRGDRPLHHAHGGGLFWNMVRAWMEGGGDERSQAPSMPWQRRRRAGGQTKKAAMLAIVTTVHQWLNPHTQGAENRDGRDLRTSPNAHLAVPFQKILPWGSSAKGQPQRLDPEPQGQRQVLSETEKPTVLQLQSELGGGGGRDSTAPSVLPSKTSRALPEPPSDSWKAGTSIWHRDCGKVILLVKRGV